MVDTVIDLIAAGLKANLSWADMCYGISTTMVTQDKDGNDVSFPAYLLKDEVACVTGDYISLVPDSKKKSIIYFELLDNTVLDYTDNGYAEMEANLTLVCWFNYKLIDQDLKNRDKLFADLIGKLPKRLSSNKTVLVTLNRSDINDGSVFNKYNYKEGLQYFRYPYGYFTVGINVLYRATPACFTVNDNPSECVATKNYGGFDYQLDITL